MAGQRYTFHTSGTWNSGARDSNADGYVPGLFDGGRRYDAKMMRLIGERFSHDHNIASFVRGSAFSIGADSTVVPPGHGFLALFSNDIMAGYWDNTGRVRVTIRRVL